MKLPEPGSKEYEDALKAGKMPSLATRSITKDFLTHVRELLVLAIKEPDSPATVKDTNNRSTRYAIPAYICAAAAIESFINELFLSDAAQGFFPQSPLWQLPEDERENIEWLQPASKAIGLLTGCLSKRQIGLPARERAGRSSRPSPTRAPAAPPAYRVCASA